MHKPISFPVSRIGCLRASFSVLSLAILVLSIALLLTGCSGGAASSTQTSSAAEQWTWISGSSSGNSTGVYGTQGVASQSNVPNARVGAASWIDSSGNFWLFGGYSASISGAVSSGDLNDLWEFNPATQQWTWVGGSSTEGASGVYGTLGVAAVSNAPGARDAAVSWTDSSGNLWLFGGETVYDRFNDLWEFNPTIKQWTWVGGSSTPNAIGIYGTQGIASSGNAPGARTVASGWIDHSGNFWLFGGNGWDSVGVESDLNDLWEFNPTTKQWTWISGSSTVGASGVYGTLGVASSSNVPGARIGATSWTDGSDNFWLFGGSSQTPTAGDIGVSNDLWEFNPTTKQWTWMSGSNTFGASGVYGTLGVASTANVPSARSGAAGWTDGSGNFWLFGGGQVTGDFNDLWTFDPATRQWTWMNGSSEEGASGVYGTLGVASPSNVPGARAGTASWIDHTGNLWLFGGSGEDATGGAAGGLNDLWRWQP